MKKRFSILRNERNANLFIIGVFLFVAIFLTWPLYINDRMILGVDAFFHIHRVYETAMQIKHGDLSYFMSIFGFGQTGRIVNMAYGPVFAYLAGALLLIVGNWFKWQFVTNVVIAFASLTISYFSLKATSVSKLWSVVGAILIYTLMPALSWWHDQAFMGVGVILLPIAVSLGMRMLQSEVPSIKPIATGILVAIGIQIHMLSTLFVVLILAFYAVPALIKTTKKGLFLRNGVLSIIIALIGSANVWWPLLSVSAHNHLLRPFIEGNAGSDITSLAVTVDGSRNMSVVLAIVFVFSLAMLLRKAMYKTGPDFVTAWTLVAGVGLMLISFQILPWQTILSNPHNPISLFQFPMRFAMPATVLLIFGMAQVVQRITLANGDFVRFVGIGVSLLMVFNVYGYAAQTARNAKDKDLFVTQPYATPAFVTPDLTLDKLANDEHATDLSLLVADATQNYPDYLPISKQSQQNLSANDWFHGNGYEVKYLDDYVTSRDLHNLTKQVDGQKLILEWRGDKPSSVVLPVAKYAESKIVVNGKALADKARVTKLGAPIVQQQSGNNRAVITFKAPNSVIIAYVVTVIFWIGLLTYLLVIKVRKTKTL